MELAASIIAVLQLTGAVIGYLNDVKNAQKECQQCTIEISILQSLLLNLRYRLEQAQVDDPWFTAVQALNIENGPLDQFKQALEQLVAMAEIQGGIQEGGRRLLWELETEEVSSILARLTRLKSLVTVALENDHLKLSQAIKDDRISAQDNMPTLLMNVVTNGDTQELHMYAQKLRVDAQLLQQHHDRMQWLSATNFAAQQNDIISRRQNGTGQWFLDCPEFKGWVQEADRILYCHGIPGAGKTTIVAIVVEHLGRVVRADVGVAYVFCNYKNRTNQRLYDLLSALLKQLVPSQGDYAAPVTRLYDSYRQSRSKPSLDEILAALSIICSRHARVYIVVDALDECTDRICDQLVQKLRELPSQNVRLLFTSRSIRKITDKFRLNTVLEIRAIRKDVEKFTRAQIPRLPKCIRCDDELTRTVQTEIVEAVDGIFLLACLYVDCLLDKRTKQQVLSTLKELSEGTATLENAYSDAIKRIDGQSAEDRLLAKRTISWISYAQRPLMTQELCHALAIELGDRALNFNNIYDVEDIISVCAGLVTVDEESNVIRLVHYTAETYLENIRLDWNPRSREEIATSCLTYLRFDAFGAGSCSSDESFEKRIEENVFLDYAARHWGAHVRPVEATEAKLSKLALAFLQDNALVSSSTQLKLRQLCEYKGYSQSFPIGATGLHLSAEFGLESLTKILLTAGGQNSWIDINSKDSYGRTPLLWAAENRHETIVKLLIDTKKVDPDSKDIFSQTPLLCAAANGHEAVVKLLIGTGKADFDSKDDYGRTPLMRAAENGHEAVVKLLIETGKVDLNSKNTYHRPSLYDAASKGHEALLKLLIDSDKVDFDSIINPWGQTPLLRAAKKGHEAVTKLLINTDKVDVDSKDLYKYTPLAWAADNGQETLVKLLIDTGKVDVNSKDEFRQTPVWRAANKGHEGVLKLLIDTGKADIGSKDSHGQTPLYRAIVHEHEAVAKLLINTGTFEVDSKDDYGITPLSRAAADGKEDLVKLLINTGKVDINAIDDCYQTPLAMAAINGHEAVVKLLIDTGQADIESNYYDNRTPLSWAAANGHMAVVKLLVGTGKVDVDSKDCYSRTPLSWAAGSGHVAVVKLFIETGQVDVDSNDSQSRTPLSWAAAGGHVVIVRLLIDTGKVDIESKDSSARTPLSWATDYEHVAVIKLLTEKIKVHDRLQGQLQSQAPIVRRWKWA